MVQKAELRCFLSVQETRVQGWRRLWGGGLGDKGTPVMKDVGLPEGSSI